MITSFQINEPNYSVWDWRSFAALAIYHVTESPHRELEVIAGNH
jgi:hypothetical protein